MVASFLIFFREIMEISLILGIIMAATRGLPGRGKWVWAGIGGGLLGSALVAYFADTISDAMEGMGQEIFNGTVLLAAVFMLGWTVIWMQSHGRAIAQRIKDTGKKVSEGDLPFYSLAVVISITMWREGSEIVLFMYGILSTSKESMLAIVMGSFGGTLAAGTLGLMLYMGLVKFSSRYIFTVTSWMLVLLACGMSAHAAGFFVAADVLPVVHYQLWDSSSILAEDSMLGKILHAMLGYTARPSGIQLIFYISTFILITGLQKVITSESPLFRKTIAGVAVSSLLAVAAILLSSGSAHAAFSVKSPHVEENMFEIELKSRFDRDERASKDRFSQHVLGVGYGFTDWWFLELEGELEKSTGNGYTYAASEIENKFQLTEPGEYWVDLGLILKYKLNHENQGADKVEGKILLQKDYQRWSHISNIIFKHEVGTYHSKSTEFETSWKTEYLWQREISPGFEYYGAWSEIAHTGDFDNQKHRIGPVINGSLPHGFSYELGWLIGVSKAAEDHVIKLNLEYEIPVEFY